MCVHVHVSNGVVGEITTCFSNKFGGAEIHVPGQEEPSIWGMLLMGFFSIVEHFLNKGKGQEKNKKHHQREREREGERKKEGERERQTADK